MNTAALPNTVQDLVRIVGYDAAFAIVKAFGGRSIVITKNIAGYPQMHHDALVAVIGAEAAAKLAAQYSGQMYIPRCQTALTQVRWRAIQEDFDAGMKVNELVAKYSISNRQIFTILKKPVSQHAHQQSFQGDLFYDIHK